MQMIMRKKLLLVLLFFTGCTSPKKAVQRMLKEKDVEKYKSYLASDCKTYLQSKNDDIMTTLFSKNLESFKILDTEKGMKYYYVSAILIYNKKKYEFINFPNNDLRFRLIREDGQWKVVLINCVNFADETIMKPSE